MTVDELAEYLSTTPKVIYQWVYLDKIPYTKIGRSLRFKESEIEEYVNINTSNSTNKKTEVEKIGKGKTSNVARQRRYT